MLETWPDNDSSSGWITILSKPDPTHATQRTQQTQRFCACVSAVASLASLASENTQRPSLRCVRGVAALDGN